MSVDKEELKRLVCEFPYVKDREPDTDWDYSHSLGEADYSYITKNESSAVWLLDNSSVILEVIEKYSRIVDVLEEDE